jgi:hypothetical protein
MTQTERRAQARLMTIELDADERLRRVALRVDSEHRRLIRSTLGDISSQLGGEGADRGWTVWLTPAHCREIQRLIDEHYQEAGSLEGCEVYPLWAAIAPASGLYDEDPA